MSNEKKQLKSLLKDAASLFAIEGFSIKWKNDSFIYHEGADEIAQIGFPFLGPKHAEFGATFGAYVIGTVNGGEIARFLRQASLSYPPRNLPKQIFFQSSLESSFALNLGFSKNGIVPVFPANDLLSACGVLLDYAEKQLLPIIKSCALNEDGLSEIIFSNPDKFHYPAIQIIYNTTKNTGIRRDAIVERIKKSKMHGSRPEQIQEAIYAIDQYSKQQAIK